MSDPKPPLLFGTETRFGETTCSYGFEGRCCTKPACWHLFWLDGDDKTSATCDEHLDFIQTRAHPEFDRHTFGANCSMPGTLWHFPYEDEAEGYCLFPANDDASALTAAAPLLAEAG